MNAKTVATSGTTCTVTFPTPPTGYCIAVQWLYFGVQKGISTATTYFLQFNNVEDGLGGSSPTGISHLPTSIAVVPTAGGSWTMSFPGSPLRLVGGSPGIIGKVLDTSAAALTFTAASQGTILVGFSYDRV